MDPRTALVRRQPRALGHLLGRLQLAPDRGAPAAGARSDRDHVLDGRPLRGRRPLSRRLRPRPRHAPLGLVDAHLERPPARPAPLRGGLAPGMAGAARDAAAMDRALARPPEARRLLEARLGVRGLLRHRVRRLRGRRLRGRVHECGAAAPGRALRPAQGHHRALGARLPRAGLPGAVGRLPAGVSALVRPLAEGHRHRRHGRADAARLDAGLGRATARVRRAAGALGGRGAVAVAAGHRPPLGAAARGAARAPGGAVVRDRGRRLDGRGSVGRPRRRPAARRRALAHVRLGAAGGAAGDPRAAGGDAGAGGRPAERAGRRAALRRLSGRHVGARHARAPEPHAPRGPRAP